MLQDVDPGGLFRPAEQGVQTVPMVLYVPDGHGAQTILELTVHAAEMYWPAVQVPHAEQVPALVVVE